MTQRPNQKQQDFLNILQLSQQQKLPSAPHMYRCAQCKKPDVVPIVSGIYFSQEQLQCIPTLSTLIKGCNEEIQNQNSGTIWFYKQQKQEKPQSALFLPLTKFFLCLDCFKKEKETKTKKEVCLISPHRIHFKLINLIDSCFPEFKKLSEFAQHYNSIYKQLEKKKRFYQKFDQSLQKSIGHSQNTTQLTIQSHFNDENKGEKDLERKRKFSNGSYLNYSRGEDNMQQKRARIIQSLQSVNNNENLTLIQEQEKKAIKTNHSTMIRFAIEAIKLPSQKSLLKTKPKKQNQKILLPILSPHNVKNDRLSLLDYKKRRFTKPNASKDQISVVNSEAINEELKPNDLGNVKNLKHQKEILVAKKLNEQKKKEKELLIEKADLTLKLKEENGKMILLDEKLKKSFQFYSDKKINQSKLLTNPFQTLNFRKKNELTKNSKIQNLIFERKFFCNFLKDLDQNMFKNIGENQMKLHNLICSSSKEIQQVINDFTKKKIEIEKNIQKIYYFSDNNNN
ncbi:hypothetical protein M0813_03557 [Anaeramoeba flamelloides]|uniref:Uncharacterized protein n=1 Tax=Anaeramoeba flamelloides TaxID=1746091 RepID=A0ABQ8XWC8_9EUKA|nr:hypothetical protein M0813_03557 [Anaeramoeba flamelloides]